MPVVAGGAASVGMGIATLHIASAIVNGITSTVNSKLGREQQERINSESRKLQRELEDKREAFTAQQNEENARRQTELAQLNHDLRLQEQEQNFFNARAQASWTMFMKNWPLLNLPEVIRQEQILPDNTVSLRVFFSKCSDPTFAKIIYPTVEHWLREFIDVYHNVFNSHNIIFYENAFVSSVTGEAVDKNIHYALRDLPVVIIDTNIIMDEINVSLTMWGLGNTPIPKHFTVFKLPYKPQENLDYYRQLARTICAYLKFIIGYAYDSYNLIEYNRSPILPLVAQYEHETDASGNILAFAELKRMLPEKCVEIYNAVLGESQQATGMKPYALLPESNKQTILHRLRLDYAVSVRDCIDDTTYVAILDESIVAWTKLRSELSTLDFLLTLNGDMIRGDNVAKKYFSDSDRIYFFDLIDAYSKAKATSPYCEVVYKNGELLRRMNSSSEPSRIETKPTSKMLKF